MTWFSAVRVTRESDREWRKLERALDKEMSWNDNWELISLYGVLFEHLCFPTDQIGDMYEGVIAGIEVEDVAPEAAPA